MALVIKNLPANEGDEREAVSIPGPGKSPGEGNGNKLQYSCLGNPTDRGAWWITIQEVTKSQTWLRSCLYEFWEETNIQSTAVSESYLKAQELTRMPPRYPGWPSEHCYPALGQPQPTSHTVTKTSSWKWLRNLRQLHSSSILNA